VHDFLDRGQAAVPAGRVEVEAPSAPAARSRVAGAEVASVLRLQCQYSIMVSHEQTALTTAKTSESYSAIPSTPSALSNSCTSSAE
jgi:hypothetical protein